MSTTIKTTMSKTELAELLVNSKQEVRELQEELKRRKKQEQLLRSKLANLRMAIGESVDANDIDSIIWYAWNYDYGFIAKCWNNDGSLTHHLENKFSNCVKKYGRNAFFMFLSELDEVNRELLYRFIRNTFSKQKGFLNQ
jgi:hypothetical protein